MNLKKLHEEKWPSNAKRSADDPDVINIKTRTIDGEELNYSIVTVKPKNTTDTAGKKCNLK